MFSNIFWGGHAPCLKGRNLHNVCFTHVYYPKKVSPLKRKILYETLSNQTAVHQFRSSLAVFVYLLLRYRGVDSIEGN